MPANVFILNALSSVGFGYLVGSFCSHPEASGINKKAWLCMKVCVKMPVLCSGSGNGPAGGAAAGLG